MCIYTWASAVTGNQRLCFYLSDPRVCARGRAYRTHKPSTFVLFAWTLASIRWVRFIIRANAPMRISRTGYECPYFRLHKKPLGCNQQISGSYNICSLELIMMYLQG